MYRTNFLGYPVDNINLNEFINFVLNAIEKDSNHLVAVQNANKMYLLNKYNELHTFFKKASIILPENAINIGMMLLGTPLKQRNMGGFHIMEEMLGFGNIHNSSLYLLGAKKENLKKLVDVINLNYPNIKILGYHDGYFTMEEELNLVNEISILKPNFLFIGLGSPKQEIFLENYYNILNANISIGVGGSFNVIAGLEKPAPKWAKYGFEWLYRAFQDPRKFKRYCITNMYFCFQFIKYILSEKV